MNYHLRPSSILLFICMVLFADTAFGQSLSFVRKSAGDLWIEAPLPPDTQYILQASANLHLWVDINDAVQDKLSYQLDSAGGTKRFFRLTPWTPAAPPIRIVLLGDSTVMDGPGWAKGVYGYFKSNAQVVNLAIPACSTKVFLASEQYTTMCVIKPDYVLVEFGYFDTNESDPRVYTTLQEYGDNLRKIVQTIRGFNGKPILVTPTVQRVFDGQGNVELLFQDRYDVMKGVAAELQTDLIDLNKLSRDLVSELGESGSVDLFWPDNTHFTDKGAQLFSGLVVNALPDYLGTYLVGIFNPIPNP
jgi:lysophospholipase L1-like esterase